MSKNLFHIFVGACIYILTHTEFEPCLCCLYMILYAFYSLFCLLDILKTHCVCIHHFFHVIAIVHKSLVEFSKSLVEFSKSAGL